jgi:hypothetical protein
MLPTTKLDGECFVVDGASRGNLLRRINDFRSNTMDPRKKQDPTREVNSIFAEVRCLLFAGVQSPSIIRSSII